MFLAAAAAIAASSPAVPPQNPARVTVQARATIRIVAGARVRLGTQEPSGPVLRMSTVRTAEGQQPAKLIEFE